MKYKGCTGYMVDDRDEDILRTFDRIMSEVGYALAMSDVYAIVANSPSKRFWVTAERAYSAVRLMRKGKGHHKPYPLRDEMYAEISRRADEMLERHPDYTLSKAVARVVEQPSPKFYMSPGTIKHIVIRLSKKAYGIED